MDIRGKETGCEGEGLSASEKPRRTLQKSVHFGLHDSSSREKTSSEEVRHGNNSAIARLSLA